MPKFSFLTLILILFFQITSNAQTIKGKITDKNGLPLAFVNIVLDDNPDEGIIADIDGNFSFKKNKNIKKLTLSYVGFETIDYLITEKDIKKGKITIVLYQSSLELNEITIIAKENPAHRIIRLAVKNKKLNNHEKLNSYTCNVYTKTQVSPIISDSTKYFNHLAERKLRKKDTTQIKKDSFSIYDFHPLQSEVVTKRLFKKPKIVQTKLIHSRVAGMKKMDFSAINYFQQFTCYENYIQFLDTDYLNPISVGSTRQYYFNIEDTLYQQTDTVFIISYKPRKNKKFEALEGTVYINSNGYAVQNIIAEPAGNKHSKWRLEHQYQFLEEKRWFPSQLNFEMRLVAPTGYSESVIRQKSYISDIEINPKLTFQELKNNYVPLTKEVTTKADSVWNKYRPEALDSKEMDSYILVDSLGKEMKLDAIVKGATSVGTGRLNVKGIDIRINDVLRFNNYETVRLGIGLQTNKDLSRYFSVGGYFGYGFKDKGIKYGGNLVIDIIPDDILELEYSYKNDLRNPSNKSFGLIKNNFINENIYANNMDKINSHNLSLRYNYNPLQLGIGLDKTELTPQYDYSYGDNNSRSFDFTEFTFAGRLAFGEKSSWVMGTRITEPSKYPVLQFSYTRGLKDVLQGEYSYNKYRLSIEQNIKTRFLGRISYKLEGGMVDNNVPYPKLFIENGAGGAFSFFGLKNTFQTMKNNEFVSDKYLNLFLEHNLGNFLVRNKFSRPQFILLHNMSIGSLNNSNVHNNINLKTQNKPFLESGVGIDNLFLMSLDKTIKIGFGARVFYRYGAHQLPSIKENMGYSITAKINF